MAGQEKKMSLIGWIPLLFVGMLMFFILYAVCVGGVELFGKLIGTAAGVICAFVFGVLIIGAYSFWCRLTEQRRASELSDKKGFAHIGAGYLVGIVYFALVAGAIALAGCYRITDIRFDAVTQLQSFAMFFVVAVAEEVIFRGILFRMVEQRFNTVAAFVVSALVFGAVHLMNPGATWWAALAIAIEAGIMLSAAYKYSGTLWMPIGIHWAWNYTQGKILGFAVSGGETGNSLFIPEISGPEIITGGAFGAEASIIAVIIGAILSALFIIAWLRDSRKLSSSEVPTSSLPKAESSSQTSEQTPSLPDANSPTRAED